MRLDTHMSQRMDQRMILAPRMIQSMEILQLPIMALQERIQQELQENPVLELKETADDQTAAGAENLEPGLGRPLQRGAPALPQQPRRGGRQEARRHAEHGLAPPVAPGLPRRPARL